MFSDADVMHLLPAPCRQQRATVIPGQQQVEPLGSAVRCGLPSSRRRDKAPESSRAH